MSSSYQQWGTAYLLNIRRTLSRGIVIDDHRNIVDMGVNTVSTRAADVLTENVSMEVPKANKSLPDLAASAQTMNTDSLG